MTSARIWRGLAVLLAVSVAAADASAWGPLAQRSIMHTALQLARREYSQQYFREGEFAFETDPGQRYIVVAEGFKAVMRIVQGGAPNTVGLLGSYMSLEQEWMLTRLECPILLMLDNNQAGRLGQRDAAERLLKKTSRVWIVDYDGDQPSDLDPSLIQPALLRAQPYAVWSMLHPIEH